MLLRNKWSVMKPGRRIVKFQRIEIRDLHSPDPCGFHLLEFARNFTLLRRRTKPPPPHHDPARIRRIGKTAMQVAKCGARLRACVNSNKAGQTNPCAQQRLAAKTIQRRENRFQSSSGRALPSYQMPLDNARVHIALKSYPDEVAVSLEKPQTFAAIAHRRAGDDTIV